MKVNITKFLTLLGVFLFLGAGNMYAEDYYLAGDFNDFNTSDNTYKFAQVGKSNRYELSVSNFSSGGFKVSTKGWGKSWGNKGNTLTKGNSLYLYDNSDNASVGNLGSVKVVIWEFDGNTMRIEVCDPNSQPSYPTSLYLMGTINSYNWDTSKGIQANGNNGVYTWNNVVVDKAASDNEYGYFSMATKLSTQSNNWGDVNQGDRYGSLRGGDTPLTGGTEEYVILYPELAYATSSADGCKPWEIKPGTYNITLNLRDMTVMAKEVVNFSWSNNGTNVSGAHLATHKKNVEYVLSSSHNTAEYDISVSAASSPLGVEGPSTLSVSEDDYTVEGNIVNLNKTGVYTLTATLKNSNNNNGYVADPAVLTATVTSLDLTTNSNLMETWQKDAITLSLLSLGSSSVDADDFTVEVKPSSSVNTTAEPSSRPDDFIDWEWNQMIGIMDSGYVVDGYYEESTYSTAIDDELTVSGHFPVSGIYDIVITSNDPDITINGASSATVQATVIPNVGLTYSNYNVSYVENDKTITSEIKGPDGININGMQINDQTIDYPYDSATGTLWGDVENARFYTPGIYLDSFKYKLLDQTNSDITADDLDTSAGQTVDISELKNTSPLYLYYVIEKNGASSGIELITLTRSTTHTTGVDAVGVEDGEAVYYNLQGVRVENPQHGIFVKVVNGKATKVVL